MHHYHHRAFYLGVLCVALIAVGLLALNFPVFLDAYDQFGFQIKCGTGYVTDLSRRRRPASTTTSTNARLRLMLRRLWTIPLVAIGSILLTVIVAWRPPFGAVNRYSGKTRLLT